MIEKSVSQLPNMHFIFYSWVQCYNIPYSRNLGYYTPEYFSLSVLSSLV